MGFNKMRIQLMDNQKKLWDTMEDQKQLNRAFAHDIRNPLTVMKGYTQMAIAYGDKKDISQDKLREILYMIDKKYPNIIAIVVLSAMSKVSFFLFIIIHFLLIKY